MPHHLELIRPALEAGKTVFSEWPLGADLAQAEELADLAHRRGVLTTVGLQARSAPPLRYLRDLVADNYAYVLDATSSGTLLSIPFGHSVDALTMVLGEFREVSAHIENLPFAKTEQLLCQQLHVLRLVLPRYVPQLRGEDLAGPLAEADVAGG
ncbi:Gfo/Idh/MocA family protein [Streptomyces yunnanensis]|uniref:Gfo/Idh/MocA family protein n=1 Tax=Streptomyces yunnanensis TaxID=156453 RepID=UPI000D1BBF3A